MIITELNSLLGKVKAKLEALDPVRLAEAAERKASHQNPSKLDGPRRRLQNLYGKLTKDRPESTKVVATGAKR